MGEALSLSPDHRPLVMRCGSEVLSLLTEYGAGALQAHCRYDEAAFASGRPSGPPNGIAEIVIYLTFEYLMAVDELTAPPNRDGAGRTPPLNDQWNLPLRSGNRRSLGGGLLAHGR